QHHRLTTKTSLKHHKSSYRPPFTAPKGIKIPSSKILLPLGMIICGHTHIQHTPVCECCFWGYVKIDKAKVFLNWVQKTKPLQKGLS
ncbi:hypothetical protein DW135_10330, partial [Bifidobacterium longum]